MAADRLSYASRAERVKAELAEMREMLGDLRENRGLPREDPWERLRSVHAELMALPQHDDECELTGSESLSAYVAKLEAKYVPHKPALTLIRGGRDDAR